MHVQHISQKRLFECVHYDPDTGTFTWKKKLTNARSAGMIAGGVNQKGYWRIRIDKVLYLGHRLAFLYMTGSIPYKQIDHINGVKSDNRWVNLRATIKDHSDNAQNRKLRRDNSSGNTGVYMHKSNKNWIARICLSGREFHLGCYPTKNEAIAAYSAGKRILHSFQPILRDL